MAVTASPITDLSDQDRTRALERFQIIRPFVEDGIPLTDLVRQHRIALRTARRWVEQYRRDGLAGLARKRRDDARKPERSSPLQELIEGLALQKPRLSIAAIHRNVVAFAQRHQECPPSYSSVYASIKRLEPALLAMAHEGSKRYSDKFDLLYRREADAPNSIWQADHTQLDIWLISEDGERRKPWLTIVLDDYSRAVAGYFLFFNSPSAIYTALALRQAIWRKETPGWHICGIPQILYTDHGCDFTSQHIEQVAADLKIRLVFSGAGRPRGRGKVERFFETLTQVLLPRFPGFSPTKNGAKVAKLRLSDFARELESFLVNEYHQSPHSTTKQAPQHRWEQGGFLPQMPDTLEQLDLLLLTVAKERCVHPDGIRFMSYRYIDPTLAAYIGERVVLRYDPRDLAEVRVFFRNRFLCRAVCQELAGETVGLREIIQARNHRRRNLRHTLEERQKMVESLLETRRWTRDEEAAPTSPAKTESEGIKLKQYFNE